MNGLGTHLLQENALHVVNEEDGGEKRDKTPFSSGFPWMLSRQSH